MTDRLTARPDSTRRRVHQHIRRSAVVQRFARANTLARVTVLAALTGLAPAQAQRVLGPFDDATVLRRGLLRISASPTWGRATERFADGLGRTPEGQRESAAADYDVSEWGPLQFPAFAAAATALSDILGTPPSANALTLGRLQTRYDATVTTTPLVAEFGVTNRLTIGAMLPLMKTRMEVSLQPNPRGTEATVGLNPAFLENTNARGINTSVVTQLTTAGQQLQAALTACAGSTAPSCTAINADRTRAQQLVTAAASTARGLQQLYGNSQSGTGNRFVPVERSALARSIVTRLTTLSSDFRGFLGAPGSDTAWITARPVGAAPVALNDFHRLVTDTTFGINADSLASVDRVSIGDIELGARVLLFDSFGARAPQSVDPRGLNARITIGVLYRFGVGLWESPDHFADIPTADSQDDIEGRVMVDVLAGSRAWLSLVARYGYQRADAQLFRLPNAPHVPFARADTRQALARDLGDYLAIDLSPRIVLSRSLALGASYQYFTKAEDAYSLGVAAGDTTRVGDPAVLVAGSGRTEQRALLALTYSTLSDYFRGRARVPIEVSLMAGRTVAGTGGALAHSLSGISVRVYNQLFGGPR